MNHRVLMHRFNEWFNDLLKDIHCFFFLFISEWISGDSLTHSGTKQAAVIMSDIKSSYFEKCIKKQAIIITRKQISANGVGKINLFELRLFSCLNLFCFSNKCILIWECLDSCIRKMSHSFFEWLNQWMNDSLTHS